MAFRNPAILATGDGAQYVEVGNDQLTGEPRIFFHTGAATEISPGMIRSSGETVPGDLQLEIRGPAHQDAGGGYPHINLSTFSGGETDINLFASRIAVSGPVILGTDWTQPALLNGWTDVAGGRVGLFKDAAGTVHVRGVVSGGSSVGLFNVGDAAYWPLQTCEFVCRGGNPGPLMCSVQVQTDGDVTILTNLTSAQARLAIDFSYSALAIS